MSTAPRGLALALCALLGGCGDDPLPATGIDAGDHDAPRDDDASPDADYVPYVAGKFTRVYAPSGGRYLNDHTLVRGPDGTWHVYGITHTSQGMPFAERQLLHATAPALAGPWRDEADALTAEGDERVLWAPHVVERAPGAWTMFYWGETDETAMPFRRGTRRADSADLARWTRHPARAPGGRDAFVLREGDRWLLYSVGASAGERGQVVVAESADLETWTTPTVVIEDPVPAFGWGNLESPFVVRYGGAYYLFVTRTGVGQVDYVRTLVFRSRDPRRFAWRPLTDIRAHAAEVVEEDGRWYLTSAGWTSSLGPLNRGLSVAPLAWARR